MEHKQGAPLQPGTEPHVSLDGQRGLTRRQFLTYVLGGTGAFMGTLVAAPMIVSAFDPLHRSGSANFSRTTWKVSDFDDKLPKHVKFTEHIDDAWNSQDKPNDVYVIKYQNRLMIMSHVCTHLGCHVDGSEENGQSVAPKYGNGQYWFRCPCHDSVYNIYGVPSDTSPAPEPLALYEYKIDSDGTVLVGGAVKRTKETWNQVPGPTIA
ncbi:MAG: ubiquinol-cytochrome c reductase iron-sulfur subunit [Alicyclobacillus macrosporangiidus]|uniref:QcrA and Rieske domain-containing protein n=1 Tax=Alicyclobacillus macrosporangiidus TaxID=392015 RepID=UPI0026F063A2|nr:ubiquinol-cytochrome c reductase iron-sulfur subunit [Alicyclobacillus macrosporangiidus]MCL6598325.1 ubiquinol-cytochrome c reductase iron-sulfur subunit [Alicyclobacillus macrosporangiidus]